MTNREKQADLIQQLMTLEAAEIEPKISQPWHVLPVLKKYRNRKQEEFVVITLNGAHGIIKTRSIGKGLINRCLVHPREVFRMAISDNAAAVILSHNHPSGNVEPSTEDIEITNRLKSAGKIIGIEIIDHIIITKNGFYSFLEEGKI